MSEPAKEGALQENKDLIKSCWFDANPGRGLRACSVHLMLQSSGLDLLIKADLLDSSSDSLTTVTTTTIKTSVIKGSRDQQQ